MNVQSRPFGGYVIGFAISVAATLGAYDLVASHTLPSAFLLAAVVSLALLQLAAQLVLFLHIGRKTPSANLAALTFTILIVGVVVGGSLWIMDSLNARGAGSARAMLEYMQAQTGSP